MPDGPRRIRFGVFEADLAAGELRRNGVRVKLQDQPFQVLATLLEKPGEVVTKEELQARIWADDTYVDFDGSLATAVNKIRQALGDSATRPRFVETVPKRGYRFLLGDLSPTSKIGDRRTQAVVLIASVALVAVAAAVWSHQGGVREGRAALPTAEPLTTLPGLERYPSLSPDGSRVAFAWKREDEEQFDLYVKIIGAGEPVPVTRSRVDEIAPAWSPDGKHIAFQRYLDSQRLAIVRIPAMGGRETVLTEIPSLGLPEAPRRFCWTPDGRGLIVSERLSDGESVGLSLLSLPDGTRRNLTRPAISQSVDVDPSVNSSGVLSFLRRHADGTAELFVWEAGDLSKPRGRPEPRGSLPYMVFHPVVSPSSEEILFSAWSPLPALWRIRLASSEPPDRVVEAAARGIHPALSADGAMLVHSTWEWSYDIWRLELSDSGTAAGPPRRWGYSTHDEMWPDYSPDASQVAFQSNRSGSHQIWIARADGDGTSRLTSIDASFAGSPAWSPDGAQIAFDSSVGNSWAIFIMSANGTGVRRLTDPGFGAVAPDWSPDGDWIYFSSYAPGRRGCWRVPAKGGPPKRLSSEIGGRVTISRDGKQLYGVKPNRTLWRLDIGTGHEKRVLDQPIAGFALGLEGVYFSPFGPPMVPDEILFHRFAGKQTTQVAMAPVSRAGRFSVSPDGRYLLFSQDQTVNSDLMLVRNYR